MVPTFLIGILILSLYFCPKVYNNLVYIYEDISGTKTFEEISCEKIIEELHILVCPANL